MESILGPNWVCYHLQSEPVEVTEEDFDNAVGYEPVLDGSDEVINDIKNIHNERIENEKSH